MATHTAIPKPVKKLVPTREAVRLVPVDITKRTLIRWAKERLLPATRVGGRWYFDPQDILSFVESSSVQRMAKGAEK